MELTTLATFAFLLTVKHTICDLALQRLYPADKSFYFNKAAHTHYFHHGVGSFFIGLMFSPYFAVAVGLLDYLIHWHVDWAKHHWIARHGWSSADSGFWWAAAIDQTLHYLTYCVIVMLVASHVFVA